MWVKFTVSAGFVGYLLYTMASRARQRERELRLARQRSEAEEHLLRAGSLAAGAAHEIRSPLCTMSVLVNELLQRPQDPASRTKSLRLMSEQIEACRHILGELMSYGQDALAEGQRRMAVDDFLHEAVGKWRMLRPGVTLACRRQGTQPAPRIATDGGLGHAILNLLNNAADASPEAVELVGTWTPAELKVMVLDRGPGFAPGIAEVAGERFLTTKPGKGTGMGLVLAKTAAERAGGRLALTSRPGGGTCAELVVPIEPAGETPAKRVSSAPPVEVRYYQSTGSGA
jgi:two-component system sensor histidine kinase RegB